MAAYTPSWGAAAIWEPGWQTDVVEGGVLVCPWHGSCFDLRDGSVARGPAVFPLPAYDTRIEGGQVEVRRSRTG